MTTKPDLDREKIRTARWEPGERFRADLDRTLGNLPSQKGGSYGKPALTVIVVAAVLLMTLALPPLLRAAKNGPIRDESIASVTTQPTATDELTLAMADAMYAIRRGHAVDESVDFMGGKVTVTSVRVRATDDSGLTSKGEARLIVSWTGTFAFDLKDAVFTLVVDGTEIPVRAFDQTQGNGAIETELRFSLDDYAWDEAKALEFKADIGGETVAIPFGFDPEKAYAQAISDARTAYEDSTAYFETRKDEFSAVRQSALPVAFDTAILDRTFSLSGFLSHDDQISLVYSISGLRAETLDDLGVIVLDNLTVDGVSAGGEQADIPSLENGVYTNVSTFALGRDPEKLPEESLIAFDLTLDDWTPRRIAFRYRWADGTFTLPADEDEMAAWGAEADEMGASLYGSYGAIVFRDLTDLALTQEIDGVMMTPTSLAYVNGTNTMQLSFRVEGDVNGSRYVWTSAPSLTIDGRAAILTGSDAENAAFLHFDYHAPISIAEFGIGEVYVLSFPLFDAALTPRELTYAQPLQTLTFEFTLD